MRSIERRFNKVAKRYPEWGSLIQFSVTIKGMKFAKQNISRWFNKLVDPEDFDKTDKKQIINQLVIRSNDVEDNKKWI